MGFSGGGKGHVVSEEAPLIRTTLSLTSAIQRPVVTLHTLQLLFAVTGLLAVQYRLMCYGMDGA